MKHTIGADQLPQKTLLAAEDLLDVTPFHLVGGMSQFSETRSDLARGRTVIRLVQSYEGDEWAAEASSHSLELIYDKNNHLRTAISADYFVDLRPRRDRLMDAASVWLGKLFNGQRKAEADEYTKKRAADFIGKALDINSTYRK